MVRLINHESTKGKDRRANEEAGAQTRKRESAMRDKENAVEGSRNEHEHTTGIISHTSKTRALKEGALSSV
jgi:hypothetical protein